MKEQLKIDFEKLLEKSNFSNKNIEFKRKSLNNFIDNGFPNKKEENWKFSDLNQIITKNITNLSFYNDLSKPNKIDQHIFIDSLEHNKLIFVNGRLEKVDFYYEEKNQIEILDDINLEKSNNNNSLISLNNAFVEKYFKLIIKKNYSLKKPLVVYNITNKDLISKNINLRVDILLEENSSLKVVEYSDDKSITNFMNLNCNFDLHKNSVLKIYKIDYNSNSNVKYCYNNINQDSNSVAEIFLLSCGSDFIKNEINCNLNGKYASAFVNGVFVLNKTKHHEIKTNINHLIENTKSYQLIKGVLEDKSKAVYQGKIFVSPKAQKTDGYQLSNAILLNDNTEFNAKPELEIYADDVKCSHGSTSGSLNEDSIFYLMSRGLNYQESKKLLINGFLLDVVEKITDNEIKDTIKNIMDLKQ